MTWSVLAMVAMVAMVAQFLHHRLVYQNVQLEQGQLVIWMVSAGCFLALLLLSTTPVVYMQSARLYFKKV